jgi:hypothetical protein
MCLAGTVVSVGLDENALGQGFDNAEDSSVLPGC